MKFYQNNAKRKFGVLAVVVIFGVLAVGGCESKEKTESPKSTKMMENQQEQRRSYAQDECPKLVQKRIDRTTVSRQEQIFGNMCEYFIYPNVGERVGVLVSDSRMKPFLDAPYYHDFANGDYKVVAGGRHVIRLQYDSFEKKPDILDYVLEIEIKSDGRAN